MNMQLKFRILDLLGRTRACFMTLVYEKKDGSKVVRNAVAMKYRKAMLAGGRDNLANTDYIAYYDVNARGVRCFSAEKLISIKCGNLVTFQSIPAKTDSPLAMDSVAASTRQWRISGGI